MNMFGLKTKEGSAKQNWLGFFFFEPSPQLYFHVNSTHFSLSPIINFDLTPIVTTW